LVLEHHGLAQSIARRYSWPGLTTEDLLQIARIGLIHAVDRYDPNRGVSFATYATHTIIGEIKRFLRDHGWPVRVPRHLRELHLRVRAAYDSLTSSLERAPSATEIAQFLAITEERVLETLELIRTASPISLETPLLQADTTEPGRLGDYVSTSDGESVDFELRIAVRTSVDSLEAYQREIVWLRYFHGLTQAEVARRLCLSQMHISRLERRALARLRLLLAEMLRR
jgi:RNA polymerase sigma-B factor